MQSENNEAASGQQTQPQQQNIQGTKRGMGNSHHGSRGQPPTNKRQRPPPQLDETRSHKIEINALKFDRENKCWVECSSSSSFEGDHQERISRLRVVTYNVWFASFFMRQRYRHLLALLQELDPHVVCLQEVTIDFLKEMRQTKWVQDNFYVSDVAGRTLNGYGVIIMSRLPMIKLEKWSLPSMMGRRLILARFNLNGEEVAIATVHLESLDSEPVRRKQLAVIADVLRANKHAALMGDFNFDSTHHFHPEREGRYPLENRVLNELLGEFIDVWPFLHDETTEKGYTFDTDANAMLNHQKHRPERMRYDRVMWKRSSCWKPVHTELVGTEALSMDEEGAKNFDGPVLPSDHFGLFAEVAFVEKEEEEEKEEEDEEETEKEKESEREKDVDTAKEKDIIFI